MKSRTRSGGIVVSLLFVGTSSFALLACAGEGSQDAMGGADGSGGQSDGAGGGSGGSGGSGGNGSGGAGAFGGLGGLGGGGGELPPGAISCDAPAVCGLQECQTEDAGADHYAACTEIEPHTNPPTSGPHYIEWAQFGIYDEPIAKGYLQHGLEHSAVALLYNCALVEAAGNSCDDLVAELEAFYDDFPNDPLCSEGTPHRLYVIPDPDLDVPFAATAWQGHLRGQCFDAERVRAFVDDHYGMNYENFCSRGVDPLDPGCD